MAGVLLLIAGLYKKGEWRGKIKQLSTVAAEVS